MALCNIRQQYSLPPLAVGLILSGAECVGCWAGTVEYSCHQATPEASQIFRAIFIDRPVAKATWTLMLQSKDRADREVILSTGLIPHKCRALPAFSS